MFEMEAGQSFIMGAAQLFEMENVKFFLDEGCTVVGDGYWTVG